MAETVENVENDANHQPPPDRSPGTVRQASHYKDAEPGASDSDDVQEGYANRPPPLRIGVTQDDHTDADERKREQRSDIRQIVSLSGITDQRPERDEESCEQSGDVRRAILAMHFARPLRQQSVTRHREENSRLTVLENEQHCCHGEDRAERDDLGNVG